MGFGLLVFGIYWFWVIVIIATNLVLAVVVYRDAITLPEPALGIAPFLWSAMSLTLPIGGMFIYWLMNHSSLKKSNFRI